MRRTLCLLGALLASSSLAACAQGGNRLEEDSGTVIPGRDSGPTGETDAQLPGIDGGPAPGTDAGGPGVDSGPIPGVDSGPPDAGPMCAGVDCSFLDGLCTRGQCNPTTGSCETAPAPDGASCDDGDPCTESDSCTSAVCAGTAVDCSGAATGPCEVGSCNPTTGACEATPAADGIDCDADPGDCLAETCQAGSCIGAPAADCSSCSSGGGSVCSGGVCGGAPTTLTYDFESGLPGGWTVGGDAGWAVDSTRAHGGSMAAHSGSISHSGVSTMTATFDVAVAAELVFWFYTSTESGFDYLEVWVDGARLGQWSGTSAWTEVAVPLGGAGTHTVEWRYDKDGSVSSGDDRVWVDDVVIRPGPPSEGFEGASLPSGYTTSGDASWLVSSADSHGGAQSAECGDIGDSQETSLFRTLTLSSSGTISFWYRVSTESSYDYLEFYLDGVREDRWSGTVGWTQASYAVGSGAHTLQWRYTKDGSVSSGSDTVWIDDVVGGAPAGGSLCGP